ncbi:MAG: hypothetical protein U1G05_19045 [Kiritimatiellia bacterium]
MKKARCLIVRLRVRVGLFLAATFLAGGCASSYLADRARDGADIFTASAGYGAGARGRVGPLSLGLYAGAGSAGLRGGQVLAGNPVPNPGGTLLEKPNSLGIQFLTFMEEEFTDPSVRPRGKLIVQKPDIGFSPRSDPTILTSPPMIQTDFTAPINFMVLNQAETAPFWLAPLPPQPAFKQMAAQAVFPLSYYTQIEAEVGLVGSVRIGFNPGELLDFLLGWTTLDVFGDDIGTGPVSDRQLPPRQP